MTRREQQPGFTLVELLVVIVITGLLIALLLPAIGVAREGSRRTNCLSNLKQIGLAVTGYEIANKRYPAAAQVRSDTSRGVYDISGWSWCVTLLPYLERRDLYDSLDIHGTPLVDSTVHPGAHLAALNQRLNVLSCPDYRGQEYVDKDRSEGALTNYKAMAATHMASLSWKFKGGAEAANAAL